MTRYVAFLRGVSPLNLAMSDLKRCLEAAGFANVRTVLASGNATFASKVGPTAKLERTIEAALERRVGRTFYTLVRSVEELTELIEEDPYTDFALPPEAKRVVTFSRQQLKSGRPLPIELDGAKILTTHGREAFSAYVPGPQGPVFMKLIESTFGSDVTTRTWDTVKKCAKG